MTFIQQLKESQTLGLKILYCALWGLFIATMFGFWGYFLARESAEPQRIEMFQVMAATGFILGFLVIGYLNLQQQRFARESKETKRRKDEEAAEFKRKHMTCPQCGGEGHVPRPTEEV